MIFFSFFLIVAFFTPYAFAEEINSEFFPVSDDKLFKIWEKRPDLQRVYPEVKNGDFGGLKNWANLHGWKENRQLSALIPEGKMPDYDNPFIIGTLIIPEDVGLEKFLPVSLLVLILMIGTLSTFYIIFKKCKK